MPEVRLLAGPGAEAYAAGFAAAGLVVVGAGTAGRGAAPGRGAAEAAAAPGAVRVLWGSTIDVLSRADGATAVILLAPEVPTRGEAVRQLIERPGRRISVPVLIQVADEDPGAQPAMRAAWNAKAHVRHYPVDRAGVLPGGAYFDRALQHAVDFITRLP